MAAASSNNNNGTIITTTTSTTTNSSSGSSIHIETDEFIKKSRVTRAAPPKPAYDPLQFVQIKPAKLYDLNKAKPSTERKTQVMEVKTTHREVEDAEEWQCNLDNWKSSRRKRVEHIIDKITEAKKIEQEEVCRGRKKSKTFSEMLENSGSKRRFILPENEDDDEGGSFSDDLHDPRDSSKHQYKDESTDERATDDTSSCCSSKLADGELKTPDPEDDTREAPEMNEFSLAIENYKSKFPMTQNRVLGGGGGIVTTTTTSTSIVSSIESNSNDNYESNEQTVESITQQLSSLEVTEKRTGEKPSLLVSIEPMESRMSVGIEQQQQQQEQSQEESPKVNVIERRRLFEQLQQMQTLGTADTKPLSAAPTLMTAGGQQERSVEENSSSSNEEPPGSSNSSSEWFAAGSIRERRAIFERYQSNEMIAEEHDHQLLHVGGRSRSSSNAAVVKSRSESNVGFINGSTGRFELALNQLKRNGSAADYCEDSGIQSTTDLSRSSMVSQADENDPTSLLLLLPDDDGRPGKSPARSATLDSASEFSDTDCSNGQLLDNALDVAFEEMDSELNESGTVDDHTVPEEQALPAAPNQEAEIVPLAVVPLATNNEQPLVDEQLVLMALPKSALTPPKEKPPPPPVDEETEMDLQSLSAGSIITSWMHKDAGVIPVAITTLQTNGNTHNDSMQVVAEHEQSMGCRVFDDDQLGDVDQWRSLESYEEVQQHVQHQQQQQLKQHEQEQELERDKDQQEMLVYSNRIETLPSHHHQLYDPGEHEEIVSVERELLQIEQEELQRRREKQMFYEKLTKADTSQHQQQYTHPVQQQSHQRQPPQQQQQPQQPYYYSHHLPHQTHHHNLHHLHHRASMPAIDSRSLQNVNSYASYETPFLDDANSSTGYEMSSLHRESMPNLSHVAASSSHPSSLSSYGEEYSANSATSFDGTCWPPVVDHRLAQGHAFFDKRPAVAPRPTMNGVPHRSSLPSGVAPRYHGGQQRMSNNMFEQHPKDSKQITQQQAMVSRGQGTGGVNNTTPYGQHWLVQEAEQRRIEQHQKSNNNAKRPLPKFVIDAITQRVQKLNAGSPENSDRSNLSEDSDLAMINSMKHHHHHQSQSMVPPPPHHHQQQPLPPPIPPQQQQQQQQTYSNTSDKVLSVSGKKECSHCRIELGKGAAMAIESLGLFYHIECFKCCVCHVKLGDGTNGIDVRVRKYRLHCQNCFSSEDGVKFSCV
ncbi:LIM domain-containing protein A [Anopheles maculipalpis]|uniref:LIM domain-containing protein A n=1 Tax=Anopheles maculipalpis TaxID=1496333 RepID=UPI0021598E04|nr:LIM domain-containing protein A [Anopheles maculipalpis]